MATNWDKFNKAVDLKGLQEDVKNADGSTEYSEIPKGKYEVELVSLEQKLSKSAGNPMIAMSFRILSGDYKNQRLFENKPIFGTKNDGRMIKSIISFLDNLDSGVVLEFHDYEQFEDVVLDVFEAIDGTLNYAVNYDPDAFFKISVDEVFEKGE